MGIAVCKAAIPEANRQLYQALYDCTNKKGIAMKRGRHNVIDIIVERQGRSVRGRVENSPASIPSTIDLCGESVHSTIYPTQTSVVRTNNSLRNQPLIDSAVQKLYTQGDIRVANNSRLEMAIADLWHCENVLDLAVESARFELVIKYARLVGSEFQIPHRRKTWGPLLKLNYDSDYSIIKEELLKEAKTFGLTFIGDGATIKQAPLMNILSMCGNTPPIVVGIGDCSEHMADDNSDVLEPTVANQASEFEFAHNAHETTTKAELAKYHHQSLFSPPVVTITKAIKNYHLNSFPGLEKALLKHLPMSSATIKGHMHQNQKGLRSTRAKQEEIKEAWQSLAIMNPPQLICNTKSPTMFCYVALADIVTGTIHTDLPGRFSV